jgi:hypothetical protein
VLTAPPPRTRPQSSGVEVIAFTVLGVALLAASTVLGTHVSASIAVVAPLLVVLCLFLVANPRVEVSLVILGLYIGLLDGYLKLSTASSIAPAVRDVLVLSVVVGALIRLAISDTPVHAPKYFSHVLLFVAFVLAQAFNPSTPGASAVLGGVRQHLEFVPLFFFGYVYMRSERRLETFLLLLLVVAAVNGIVAAYQYNLPPDQLASWGPGYSDRILGTGAFQGAARTFADASGAPHVRPFGLGSDIGSAGVIGWSALTAALTFIAVPRNPRLRVTGVIGLIFCVLAVLTSQSKQVVIVAVFVPVVFAALTVTSREAARGLMTVLVGGLIVYVAATGFIGHQGGAGSRLGALGSGQLQSTIAQERGSAAKLTPTYAWRYPLGDGLGRAGPAAGFGGARSSLNAENEPNFLIGELGSAGLVILLTLWLRVIFDGVRAVRRTADTRVRLFLAALLASVLGSALSWASSTPTVSVPTSPMFWFATGIIAWAAANGAHAFSSHEQHVVATSLPEPVPV